MFHESLHAQSRKVERKPCGTAAISQSLSRSNSTADARSARPRGREPGQGAFADQLPLELGQRREDAEHEAAGGGGVDLRALPGERRWCADSARWASSGRHVDHRDRRRVMISM